MRGGHSTAPRSTRGTRRFIVIVRRAAAGFGGPDSLSAFRANHLPAGMGLRRGKIPATRTASDGNSHDEHHPEESLPAELSTGPAILCTNELDPKIRLVDESET